MKKFVLLALLMSTILSASAQWVTIPDDNFANKLNELFPECMDGNQMDTECPGIIQASGLYLSYLDISDLTGIEHFTSLWELYCGGNNLSTLPTLPPGLSTLVCDQNNLNGASLTNLPESLTQLNCSYNPIIDLIEIPPNLNYLICEECDIFYELGDLPESLISLNCTSNDIPSLPELPSSLTELICSHNNLSNLPALPNSLIELTCFSNDLTELPQLPNSLQRLDCASNQISELPALPNSLTDLICTNNNLIPLPELPNTLEKLYCGSNSISELPILPNSLEYLRCEHNDLSELPILPNFLEKLECQYNDLIVLPDLPATLTKLFCQNNLITCLPILPTSLTASYYFIISVNPISCLPNYVPAMTGNNEDLLSYPLCYLGDTDSNPYGCSSFTGIGGTVYEDVNGNCAVDTAESGVVNATIKLLNADEQLMATTYTFGSSEIILYNLVADTGIYTVQLVTENMPFQTMCDDPGDVQNVGLTGDEPSALNVDFGVECLPGFDIGVQSVVSSGWVFPGQVHALKIAAGDMSAWYGLQCAEYVSGTVTVHVDGPVNYVEPGEDALTPIVSGDLQFTYDIADFSNVNFQQDFVLLFETDTTAQADDLVCVDITVDPIDGDFNPENNTYTHCYEVTNSYDPNIKQVWPHNVGPGFDGYFNYTIYFQNTGTAPAFNIRVADTLDTNLDLSTFEVTAYSHPCLTYVEGDVATFRFNNIMLPDSTSDFEGSIGYVQYRIKPISDLPVGTIIENTAHIFFDFNDAIVTNTTQNEFVITTSYNDLQQQLATVFPNPGTGQFNVLFRGVENGLTTHLEVYSLSGQRVLQQQVNENRMTLDLTDYPSGMYLLHVRNARGSEAVKLMKQ